MRLKLFVWTNFAPDYTGGLAFAIAENETEARQLVVAERGYSVYYWGDLTIYPISKKIARCVSGGS